MLILVNQLFYLVPSINFPFALHSMYWFNNLGYIMNANIGTLNLANKLVGISGLSMSFTIPLAGEMNEHYWLDMWTHV